MGNDKLDDGLIYSGVSSEWANAGDYTITIDTSAGSTVGGIVTPTYTTTIDNLMDDPIDLDLTLTHTDFENQFPDWNRIQSMIEEYPALRIALEKFESAYRMCIQDYKGKLKERGLDDKIPF